VLDKVYQKTGVPRENFKPTKWGYDKYGKSHPTELKVPKDGSRQYRGAEVNIDLPVPSEDGALVSHVGYQAPGKKSQGGNLTGHILLDLVPYNRGRLYDKKG
jgi:Bacterial toxin 47